MRRRLIALGCSLTGALGFLALPPAAARADSEVLARVAVRADQTGSATANKAAVRPRISISAPVTDNRYGARVRFTVTLGPTFADRRVTLYASPYGERRRSVATGKVNAQGKWYPTYSITRKTTFTIVFAGDAHDGPNSAHTTLNAYARVANRISGYFKTTRISGRTYDVFHGRGTLTLYSTVTPNKHGQCLEPETEQYDSGTGWNADTKYGCDTLNSTSHDTAPFSLNTAVGDRYRIRGDYFRGSRDRANLNEQGPWLYFVVTK
jgi:hypothetical protein